MPEGARKYIAVPVEKTGNFSLPQMEELSSTQTFPNGFIIF